MRYAVVITHKVENGRVIVDRFSTLAGAEAHAERSASDEWNVVIIDTRPTPIKRIK
jgi:hypothetical protein